MKKILLLKLILLCITTILPQEPESFFPHNVGDYWEYVDDQGGLQKRTILRDSIGPDNSHNIFTSYDVDYEPKFRVDTALNVFYLPQRPFGNYLKYKLDADTGEVWENPQSGSLRWAWVARIETAYVFTKLSVIKIFRFGPEYDDSANSRGLLDEWLASGIGLIYAEDDAGYIALRGCVIDGDTSGFITTSVDDYAEMPSAFQLKQNYPNPFNPSTTIEFDLPNEAIIKLGIYDMLGQLVTELYNGWKSAGNYKLKWDAAGMASGIYICRLQINGTIKSIKMILIG